MNLNEETIIKINWKEKQKNWSRNIKCKIGGKKRMAEGKTRRLKEDWGNNYMENMKEKLEIKTVKKY